MDIFKLYFSSHNDGCSCGDSHDDLDFDGPSRR